MSFCSHCYSHILFIISCFSRFSSFLVFFPLNIFLSVMTNGLATGPLSLVPRASTSVLRGAVAGDDDFGGCQSRFVCTSLKCRSLFYCACQTVLLTPRPLGSESTTLCQHPSSRTGAWGRLAFPLHTSGRHLGSVGLARVQLCSSAEPADVVSQ